jgi:2-dehydro-3-deoxygluconokinase
VSDLVTFGETMLRLAPPRDERIENARELDVRAAGAESNVAVAAQRLGADSMWLSKLPDTALGRRVVNELRWHGIDTDVVWTDAADNRQGLYFLERAGEPRGHDVIYDRTDSAITSATPDELATGHIENSRAFHVSGITPALSNRLAETTANLMSIAGKTGTKVSFDVNYRSKLWKADRARAMLTKLFPAVDVLITKVGDAREVLDIGSDAQTIAHQLASKWDFDTVIVTRGHLGALALHDGVLHEQDVFEADIVDPVGSGDAFSGAYIARRLAGDDVPSALEQAAATAALKRTIPGDVAAVSLDEVREVIEQAGENSNISR